MPGVLDLVASMQFGRMFLEPVCAGCSFLPHCWSHPHHHTATCNVPQMWDVKPGWPEQWWRWQKQHCEHLRCLQPSRFAWEIASDSEPGQLALILLGNHQLSSVPAPLPSFPLLAH